MQHFLGKKEKTKHQKADKSSRLKKTSAIKIKKLHKKAKSINRIHCKKSSLI